MRPENGLESSSPSQRAKMTALSKENPISSAPTNMVRSISEALLHSDEYNKAVTCIVCRNVCQAKSTGPGGGYLARHWRSSQGQVTCEGHQSKVSKRCGCQKAGRHPNPRGCQGRQQATCSRDRTYWRPVSVVHQFEAERAQWYPTTAVRIDTGKVFCREELR